MQASSFKTHQLQLQLKRSFASTYKLALSGSIHCISKSCVFLHCRDTALREVPVQVVSESTAEAQAAGQHAMERAHVAVSVTASVEQVYQTIKVTRHFCAAVHSSNLRTALTILILVLLGMALVG